MVVRFICVISLFIIIMCVLCVCVSKLALPGSAMLQYAKAGLLPDGTKRGKCPDGGKHPVGIIWW